MDDARRKDGRGADAGLRVILMPMPTNPPIKKPRFCSECGTRLNADALFCHDCGAPIGEGAKRVPLPATAGTSNALRWGVPSLAIAALIVLSVIRAGSAGAGADAAPGTPLGSTAGIAPDISSMSPEERADRLFNRVMRLSSEGKADSAAFFASMAMGALEALTPLDAHRRYDVGLVALVTGNPRSATAQADTILKQQRGHLLGLALAARAADARGDASAASGFRRRLLAAEATERARALPEYTDHDADIRAAVALARNSSAR